MPKRATFTNLSVNVSDTLYRRIDISWYFRNIARSLLGVVHTRLPLPAICLRNIFTSLTNGRQGMNDLAGGEKKKWAYIVFSPVDVV